MSGQHLMGHNDKLSIDFLMLNIPFGSTSGNHLLIRKNESDIKLSKRRVFKNISEWNRSLFGNSNHLYICENAIWNSLEKLKAFPRYLGDMYNMNSSPQTNCKITIIRNDKNDFQIPFVRAIIYKIPGIYVSTFIL